MGLFKGLEEGIRSEWRIEDRVVVVVVSNLNGLICGFFSPSTHFLHINTRT